MEAKTQTLRALHAFDSAPRPARAPRDYSWILDDEELTPRKPRAEVPLSAWA